MRALGRVVAVVAAIGVLGWVATVVVLGGSHYCDASGRVPDAIVVGDAVMRSGAAVTFAVETSTPVADEMSPLVEPGESMTVVYRGDDARFVHIGEHYQVTAIMLAERWLSNVGQADECSDAIRTVHADGTAIDTGILTRDGIQPYVGRIVVTTIVLLGASVIAVVLWRRHQRPRLTIDGRPLP